jgi:hypothetical protein
MAYQSISKEKIEKPELTDYWFNDIQVLTSRHKDLFFAAHGGHNAESHNHNDVGDFIFYAKGEPIIIDAGRGNYTARTFSSKRYELWFTQSEYHNLPLINGIGQKAGREFESSQLTHTINDKMSGISLDLTKAYPENAGIKNYNRSIQLNKVKEQIEINDVYELEQNKSKLQQAFMTLCKIDLLTPGVVQLITSTGDKHSIKYDSKQWTVSVDLPSTDGPEYKSFKTKWANGPVQRILFQAIDSQLKGKNLFVIR